MLKQPQEIWELRVWYLVQGEHFGEATSMDFYALVRRIGTDEDRQAFGVGCGRCDTCPQICYKRSNMQRVQVNKQNVR